MKHYLIVVWGGTEPQLCGPFANEEARDQEARDQQKADPNHYNTLVWLDADEVNPDWENRLTAGAFTNVFFDTESKHA